MTSNAISRLTVNFSGKVRRATWNGKSYLVAPMVLINPGVLNGSKGPLLYPPDEIVKNYQQWNGVPIVVYHPHRLGQPVSATEPGILDRQGVGVVRNATSNGKLRAEGWFDEIKTKKVNPGVYNRLINHQTIELSTGLFTDNEESSGTFNGRQYVAIARNYRADHLAVLPDQIGACSVKDGCGVLVNKENKGNKMKLQDKLSFILNGKSCEGMEDEEKNCDAVKNAEDGRDITELKTDNLREIAQDAEDHDMINGTAKSPNKKVKADKGAADQSQLDEVEEENCDTVQNLSQKLALLVGNLDELPQPSQQPLQQPTAAQPSLDPNVWLQKQIALLVAKFQEMSKPTHNQQGGPTMADVKLTANERKAVVDGLIDNEGCCWEESDRETLNTLSDVTLAKLTKQQELVKNASMPDELEEDDDDDVAVKEIPTKKGTSQAEGKVAPTGELNPTMKNNQAVLNEQDRADLSFARRYRMEQRQRHVKTITSNANNKFTEKQLNSMDDGVLANMAALAQQEVTDNSGFDAMSRPNFFGAQGAAVTANAGVDEEPLRLGRIDFKELAAANKG